MTVIIPHPYNAISPAARGRTAPAIGQGVGIFRLPTDPLFFAQLTLDNIVVGSRYRVTRRSNGEELATGVAASTTEVIAGISIYSNPMLVDITVRNASGSPAYSIFDTSAFMTREGATAYILQRAEE